MRILLVGHGRMGKLVASLAGEYGCEVAGIIDSRSAARAEGPEAGRWRDVEVAIDFSLPQAVPVNVPALAQRGINVVVGTTGWSAQEPAVRAAVEKAGVGVVAASNFSTGVVLFEAIVAQAAGLFAAQDDFGAWIHEAHHAAKKDAPSGTALALKRAMESAGYRRAIDVSSTRAGHIPGTHTIGFDGPVESITLTHAARDRSTFARGALVAARWIKGRRGWYTMRDVLGVE
ncbi:MAG: 4-hydroxy-tetrahydrodipicolinate reductase [Betaproteobacteria bacterium]